MRLFIFVLLLCITCSRVAALGEDQLYTGDTSTVAPGHILFQLNYNTTFGGATRLAGTTLRFGITPNADAKVSYGYLWNFTGPDVTLGPTVGAKWRFLGDGKTNTSLALSGLYAINQSVGGVNRKSDTGGLLIIQQPFGYVVLLANFGHVWVGDDIPDLRYMAFAVARNVSPRVLVALQYVNISQIGEELPGRDRSLYAFGLVYRADPRVRYALQIGYLPEGRVTGWNATLGFGYYY